MLSRIFYTIFIITSLNAQSLQECVTKVLETHPAILKQYNNFMNVSGDISVAQSGYYPTLDLSLGAGTETRDQYNRATGLNDIYDQQFSVNEYALRYNHNIFEGFATYHRVAGEKARTASAAYAYIEQANATVYEMVDAYLQQLKHYELLQTAQENVEINKKVLKRVQKLFKSGLTTYSEVNKVNASYALSLSNYILQDNNYVNAKHNAARIFGEELDTKKMSRPVFKGMIPGTLEEGLTIALKNNPSLLVSEYNIKSAQEQWKSSRSRFYPSVDIEVSQTLNENVAAIEGNDDRFRAMVVLKYNLFNGFADSSEIEKSVSKVNLEQSALHDIQRKIKQDLQLALTSFDKLTQQVEYVRSYKDFADKTLVLYAKEFDLGRRSLLDLLSVQNELIGAKSQIINIEYGLMSSRYRILNSMGSLVSNIMGDNSTLYSKVKLLGEGS